ncbi:MAG: hypothetical protein MT336_05195 [Candidatus Nitrosopumilus limneticus]|nr:hypothetical protein [Candidatus Nitrosopumilus limneticus]
MLDQVVVDADIGSGIDSDIGSGIDSDIGSGIDSDVGLVLKSNSDKISSASLDFLLVLIRNSYITNMTSSFI